MIRGKVSEVWRLAEKKIPKSNAVDIAVEINHVLHYLSNNEPDIYKGWPLPSRTDEEVIQLARDLSYNATEPVLQVRFAFLAAAFEVGNESYGWNMPLVPTLVRINKPDNWATTDRFAKRGSARNLEKAFGKDLERPISKDPITFLGRVLFTAMMFGCLLERKWLTPFLEAVIQRQFFQFRGILWIEMVLEQKRTSLEDDGIEEKSFYTKRFFPDNLTLALLYRGLDLTLFPTSKIDLSPWEILRNYIKELPGLSSSGLPNSLNEFLSICIARNLFLPGSLLSYATGKLKSTSLAIGPWLRCISNKAIVVKKLKATTQQENVAIRKITECKAYSVKRQEELFKKLRKSLKPPGSNLSSRKARGILAKFYRNHKTEISPTFQLMILWGRQLLHKRLSYKERRRKSDAVRVSTLRRYFRAIDTSLLIAAGNENLVTIDQYDLELIYEQAIGDRLNDTKAAQCLGQFHGFLRTAYKLPPLESLELKGRSAMTTNDNANLITLAIYNLVLVGLGWCKENISRWQELRILAWIICYRCGLRPGEVLKLRIFDIQITGPYDFELLVSVQPKTERGKRRIPGSFRCTKEEIDFIFAYLKKRRNEMGLFGEDNLFAHPEQQSGRLSDNYLFDSIRQLLLQITKDETVRVYHARHTFNSALQIQFQLRGKSLFDDPDFLDLEVSTDNDTQLRMILMGNEDWGRKDQHIQAILTGHSTAEITNQYYNHLNDVLLGCLVRQKRDQVPITLKSVMILSGLGQSRAGELIEVNREDHPLTLLVKSRARLWEEPLRHPLLDQAEPLRLPRKRPDQSPVIATWENTITPETAMVLKRGKHNWDLAYQIYEGVRRLDGKRIKTAKKVILDMDQQLANPSKTWRGPTYSGFTDLKIVLDLLKTLGIRKEAIILVHHPLKKQSEAEQKTQTKRWQDRFEKKVGRFSTGKAANIKHPCKKGCVEVRIIHKLDNANPLAKQPAVSRGFELAISMLAESIRISEHNALT